MKMYDWKDYIVYHGEDFKLRWYKIGTPDDGNLACETYHKTWQEMFDIQKALFFVGIDYAHIPTMWRKISNGWERIDGINF